MLRRLLKPLAPGGALLSRRKVLGALTRVGMLLPVLPALTRTVQAQDDAELRALAGLIRELVPHAVEDAVYRDAATAIRGVLPVTAAQIEDGLRQLRQGDGTDLPGSDPLLAQLRSAAVEALYRDPRVWKLIGYGGNALAKGGYVADYNSIDWLPESRK